MTDRAVGSILICNDELHPLGIVTDKDLRSKVVAGNIPVDDGVHKIMSTPVFVSAPDCQRLNFKWPWSKNINHLVVTHNGETDTAVLGIIWNTIL